MKHITALISLLLLSIPLAHAEPVSEPVSGSVSEPVSEPVSGSVSEPVSGPVKLKCVMADGVPLALNYTIDIDDKTVKWGLDTYDIVHVNDGYITAYQRTKRVGGEVLVFNRVTGDYRRAKIALLSAEGHQLDYSPKKDAEKEPEGKLETHVYEGHCPNQEF